jgi:hydrocephalus-inducing protein
MFIRLIGKEEQPLQVFLSACGIGPRLVVEPRELNWGNASVLQRIPRALSVTNDSLIPAEVKVFIMKKASRFSVQTKELMLAPGQTIDVTVFAELNELQSFKDELCLMVKEGIDVSVPLIAKGVGTTLFCDHRLDEIDLGNVFTSRPITWTYTLINRGTKAQSITWVNLGPVASDTASNPPASVARSVKSDAMPVKNAPNTVFSITPDKVSSLQPGDSVAFVLKGQQGKPGAVIERLGCWSALDKSNKQVYDLVVKSSFYDPLVEFSVPRLDFEYKYQPGVPIYPQNQPLTLKNVSVLPLECLIKQVPPFSVEPGEVEIQPGESVVVTLNFDPGWKSDRQSVELKEKLVVAYRDHPQKDCIDLFANICFPNLTIEKSIVDFGAILNETTKRVKVKVSNPSAVDTVYNWAIAVEEPLLKDKDMLPVNNIFDVVPHHGALRPGEFEWAEFVFYGQPGKKYYTVVGASNAADSSVRQFVRSRGGPSMR